MDYPFFTRELGVVPDDLIKRLRELMHGQETVHHESFAMHQAVQRGLAEVPISVIREIIQAVGSLKAPQYVGYKIDVLKAGDRILKHSDLSAAGNRNVYNCAHRHNLHIPIWVNDGCAIFHTRSTKSAVVTKTKFSVGRAYLFNDYTPHWVHNDGDTDRVHMLLYFEDPNWESKLELFQKFGIPLDHYYEIP
jgi:hypothetical protein